MNFKLIYYHFWKKNCILTKKIFLLLKILNLRNQSNFFINTILLKKTRILKASTKCRSNVAGGGRKPRKQKGTGLARLGSIRSPLVKGGGVIFGPKPLVQKFKINKKEKKLYFLNLLYNKQKHIRIINDFYFLNFEKLKLLIKQNLLDKNILFIYSLKNFEISKIKILLANFSNITFDINPMSTKSFDNKIIYYSLEAFKNIKYKYTNYAPKRLFI